MSQHTESLLLRIYHICLRISAQGRWHAFFDCAPHVAQISVRIRPTDHVYQVGELSPPPVFERHTYYAERWNPERTTDCINAELLHLQAELEPYLSEAEAAA